MPTISETPAPNERGKWITTTVLLVIVAGMFALSFVTREYYVWSLFKAATPGGH